MSDQHEAEPSAAPYVPTATAEEASPPAPDQPRGRQPLTGNAIITAVTEGHSVVIVSSELDEIYALSDRIAVMYEGKIVGFCPPDTPEEELGLMMAGAGVSKEAQADVPEPQAEEPAP